MINFHPTDDQLRQYVEGFASPAQSLMISAHVDMCQACQEKVELLNQECAEQALQGATDGPSNLDADLCSAMISQITELPASEGIVVDTNLTKGLELDGREFMLPRALQRYAKKTDSWSKIVGKLWHAPVDLGPIGRADFIYMEKGGSVPEHTHKGNELTLVINGEFEDEMHLYDSGDFIALDGRHQHTPISNADEGCLVFSIVDQPLHFTSGLARLLNPFSQLFFNNK